MADFQVGQGWDFIKKGVDKIIDLQEGKSEQKVTAEEYMQLYTTVFTMARDHGQEQQLYDRYRQLFEEYLNDTVLPAIRDTQDEFLLKEFVRRWDNHKVMVNWLSRFFNYLERFFIRRRHLPCLPDVGLICFCDLVYQEVKHNVKDAVIVRINKEREGAQIDRTELKNTLAIFVEMGMKSMDAYENDFEIFMLEDAVQYYGRKTFSGFEAEECLKREKERVEHYLHASSEPKLLKVVSLELSQGDGKQGDL